MATQATLPVVETANVVPERRLGNTLGILQYMLAGSAVFTFRSIVSGTRFTYKIQKPKVQSIRDKEQKVWFVKIMTGPDNNMSYQYLGMIKQDDEGLRRFYFTRASKFQNSQGSKAFVWAWNNIEILKTMPEKLEIWHSGRCGRCNKLLTVPESIARGIGPECWSKL